ncbi:MAG: MFS transporter [Dehalococcoidia bacterium]|nr:MFS transporter [Dehalococcoidia bacterium]
MVGVALLVNGIAGGAVWSSVGVWIEALEVQFAWSRTQLAGAFSLSQLESSFVGPLAGFLTDRFGPRRMVLVGLIGMGIGFLVFSLTTNIAIFYLAFIIIMLGAGLGTFLPVMTALNRWFLRRRGTAIAIAGEGYFLSGIAIVPILAWAVTPGHVGWEDTSRWIGFIILASAWPVSRLVRNRPEDSGQYPDGDEPAEVQAAGQQAREPEAGTAAGPDFTVRQALRTPAFWYITFGHSLSSMLNAALTVHLILMLTDQDLSLQMASFVWSVIMATGAVFQLIGGYLGDRLSKRLVLFVCGTVQAAGFAGFALAALTDTPEIVFLFGVVYGAGFGARIPLTTAIRGDYFGRKAFASIMGISSAPMYLLMLVAPLFAGAMYDLTDSYVIPFMVLAAMGSLSGVCFLMAKKPEWVEPAWATGQARQRA